MITLIFIGGIMNLSEEELLKEKTHLDKTIKLLRNQISELAQDLYDD